MKEEIYICIDTETDGPCPGLNSMLSLGAVAVTPHQGEISSFYVNVLPLSDCAPDPQTQQWWQQHAQALAVTQVHAQPADLAMHDFSQWLENLPGRPVAVAYPAGFDFSWVYYYLHRFVGKCVLSHSCIDMKTLAWCVRGGKYGHATKRNWPKTWFHPTLVHDHHALTDAREQAYSFLRMWQELRPANHTQP